MNLFPKPPEDWDHDARKVFSYNSRISYYSREPVSYSTAWVVIQLEEEELSSPHLFVVHFLLWYRDQT
jgi:hypothetical protein